jgi:hypothetical protein
MRIRELWRVRVDEGRKRRYPRGHKHHASERRKRFDGSTLEVKRDIGALKLDTLQAES